MHYWQKHGISGEHNGNTRIWHFGLLEMAWHQTKTRLVTEIQCTYPQNSLYSQGIHHDIVNLQEFCVFYVLLMASNKLFNQSVTLHMRIAFKSHCLFVVGVKSIPANNMSNTIISMILSIYSKLQKQIYFTPQSHLHYHLQLILFLDWGNLLFLDINLGNPVS